MHRASVLQRKRENGEPGRNINASDASGDKMACDINPLSEVHIGRLTSLYIRYACEIEEHRLMLARILADQSTYCMQDINASHEGNPSNIPQSVARARHRTMQRKSCNGG